MLMYREKGTDISQEEDKGRRVFPACCMSPVVATGPEVGTMGSCGVPGPVHTVHTVHTSQQKSPFPHSPSQKV